MRPASHSILLAGLWALLTSTCAGQETKEPAATPSRITTAIDNGNLVPLVGNVHPLAHAEFDRGYAGDALPLHRMLLLLRRSPEQESALGQFLEEQQNKASANYQKWLTPEQFGARFGPADADIQAIEGWLGSQGFTDMKVGPGRTTIELSGNVGQVRNAFHTEIHQYAVKEETHFANASDPQIPAALSGVVAGMVSLNNFPVRSHMHLVGTFQKSLQTGQTTPLFTFPGCGAGNCFAVGPADFATIYNTRPLLTGSPKIDGSGQGIAIVGESNINVQDVIDFRTMFGLPQNFSASNVILNGPDPGINGTEVESDLDVQWSGAVAPGARIDFVTSASTETTPGVHLSAMYIVDHNVDAVMSESFGACEQSLGTTLNSFYNSLWQQAAAQGITVILSAGDGGSAGCDDFNTALTATRGLAVSGLASTPFNVAVGGTDFDQFGRESQFWDTTATSIVTLPIPSSAKSYIPEVPWNDSCAQNGLTGCRTGYLLDIIAGSGGVSTIYAKPSWQVGKGVPNNSHRNLPDVSLFAGNGFNESFYIICAGNLTPGNNCNLTNFQYTFQGVGGTSVSAPAFAGIMALVNQKQASGQNPAPRQGNANYFLYALAQQQNTANLACNSSSAPAVGCNFNDTTKGNNAVPCTGGSTNCSTLTGQGTGVLVPTAGSTTPAYTTTAGYDLATGLGSVNAQNLVNKWASVNTTASTTTLTLNGGAAVNVTHGQPIAFSIAVSPGSANGDTSLIAVPNGGLPVGVGPFPLVSGMASGTTKALPGGGSYNVRAHYEGNGTAAPSDSAPVAVTIAPEASKLTVTIPVFDPSTGQETGKSPTTLVYGSPYILRADVTNAGGSICAAPACPTGTVTFTDTVGGVTQGTPNSGTFALNIAGYTENLPVQFPGGSNLITATYSGDSSFAASTQPTTYTLVVTPAPTRMSDPYVPTYPVPVGTPTTISAFLITDLRQGAAPGGTITFFDGATPIPGTVTLTPRAGDSSLDASISGKLTETFTSSGIHTLTAQYSGDGSYAAATSNALDALVLWPTTMALSKTFENVNYGDSVTVTATVTTPGKTPPITGQFNFSPGPTGVTPTLTTDASGNQTLTATATITPTASIVIQVGYSGDGNYERASENDFINLIVPDFTMTSAPAALTMTAGQQSTVTYTVAPMTSKSSTVELNCTFPALWGVTCAITPASVNLTSGAPASAILTLSAQGSSAAATAAVVRKRSVIGPFFVAQWPWSGGLVAVALIILLLPGRLRRHSLATALGAAVVIVAAFGCGGGASSGGDGGGGTIPTSIAITVPISKAPQGTVLDATATVTSSKPLTGTITFWETGNNGALTPPLLLSNGTARTQLNFGLPGIHQVHAEYSGDAQNQKSQSATVTIVATGTSYVQVTGTTGPLTHYGSVDVTIQ